MLAAIDWEALTPAAAFVLGAVLATVGTIRVVRAVTIMFGGELRGRRRRDDPQDDDQ
jgi:hypothetical protein